MMVFPIVRQSNQPLSSTLWIHVHSIASRDIGVGGAKDITNFFISFHHSKMQYGTHPVPTNPSWTSSPSKTSSGAAMMPRPLPTPLLLKYYSNNNVSVSGGSRGILPFHSFLQYQSPPALRDTRNIMFRSFLLSLLFIAGSLYTALAGTSAEGLAYLDAKGKEEGVVTLPSGLMYKEIRAGNPDGKTPTINSPCECHYSGTLIDGTEFDSSYKRGEPLTFAPNQVIRGWTEAMQLMKEGGKWELYIPSELGYGDRGAGGAIPPGAVLIFTLELLKVNGDYVKEAL
ncbi:hypothetical protein HJC23_001941 [Cyclotella cryptica]|uniref:peptidylprolyl isomerase n=1 Tax=Cyclotella cryptica TaxID=29204 RepID=A0ABD3PGR2_9STRA